MTPADRGRHCAKCDKVVRDFVGMDTEAILEELKRTPGKVCGQLDRKNVSTELIKDQVWAKYPVERLRTFVLAFVLVFGIEVWGVTESQAQTVQPVIEKMQASDQLLEAVKDSAATIRISGKVEDVYTREPVMQARISVYHGGVLIGGDWSKEDGSFAIEIARDSLAFNSFDLQLYHNGKIRWDSGIHRDLREFRYLIDASLMLKGISIEEEIEWSIRGDLFALGMFTSVNPVSDQKQLYRPLDEWLMMHQSEIKHTGRW